MSLLVFQLLKLQHSLIFLAVFQVLNFRSYFEALNDVFWENWEQHGSINRCYSSQSCSSWTDLSNEMLCASNGDHMPKLQPQEVDVLVYPNGAHNFGASSPTVRFFDVQGFPLFINNKQAFEAHCKTVQRHEVATSLLRDKLPSPQLVSSHFCL